MEQFYYVRQMFTLVRTMWVKSPQRQAMEKRTVSRQISRAHDYLIRCLAYWITLYWWVSLKRATPHVFFLLQQKLQPPSIHLFLALFALCKPPDRFTSDSLLGAYNIWQFFTLIFGSPYCPMGQFTWNLSFVLQQSRSHTPALPSFAT